MIWSELGLENRSRIASVGSYEKSDKSLIQYDPCRIPSPRFPLDFIDWSDGTIENRSIPFDRAHRVVLRTARVGLVKKRKDPDPPVQSSAIRKRVVNIMRAGQRDFHK
jgi:hypothetical protein